MTQCVCECAMCLVYFYTIRSPSKRKRPPPEPPTHPTAGPAAHPLTSQRGMQMSGRTCLVGSASRTRTGSAAAWPRTGAFETRPAPPRRQPATACAGAGGNVGHLGRPQPRVVPDRPRRSLAAADVISDGRPMRSERGGSGSAAASGSVSVPGWRAASAVVGRQ